MKDAHHSEEKSLQYKELKLNTKYKIGENEFIEAFKTDHTVPSCGYVYEKNSNSILITADTYSLDSMIEEVEKNKKINSIVVECSFPSRMENLAKESKHLTPKILFEELLNLKSGDVQLYINHIKPTFINEIMSEIEEYRGKWEPEILRDGEILKF